MANDFRDFDDDPFEETPDWLLDDDLVGSDLVETAVADEDEFDQLRRKSARSGDLDDEMVTEAESAETRRSGGAFAWSNFTPGQRLVLAFLIILDIIAIAFLVLLFAGFF